MPKVVQFRRGTSTDLDGITPAEGEILIDLTAKSIRVGDGIEQGGFPMINAADSASLISMAGDVTAINTRLDDVESDALSRDARVSVLETTNIWETTNDSRYIQTGDVYDKTETQQLVTNELSVLQTSLPSIYALKTEVYTQTDVEDRIGVRIDNYMQNDLDLSSYRLITDSYSSAEVDTAISNLSTVYYSRTDSDAKFATLDLTYSRTFLDSEFQQIRDNTYTKTEVDSHISTATATKVEQTDPLMDLAKKVEITETATEICFDFCKSGSY